MSDEKYTNLIKEGDLEGLQKALKKCEFMLNEERVDENGVTYQVGEDCAIKYNQVTILEMLMDQGMLLRYPYDAIAIGVCRHSNGDSKLLDTLTKRGVSVNTLNDKGRTVLWRFVENVEFTKSALEVGVDPSVKDNFGFTVYDFVMMLTQKMLMFQLQVNKYTKDEFQNIMNVAEEIAKLLERGGKTY